MFLKPAPTNMGQNGTNIASSHCMPRMLLCQHASVYMARQRHNLFLPYWIDGVCCVLYRPKRYSYHGVNAIMRSPKLYSTNVPWRNTGTRCTFDCCGSWQTWTIQFRRPSADSRLLPKLMIVSRAIWTNTNVPLRYDCGKFFFIWSKDVDNLMPYRFPDRLPACHPSVNNTRTDLHCDCLVNGT